MLQDIIHFTLFGHSFAIHGFGLMMVIGFLCAMALAKFLARRSGLDQETFANAALLGLFTGVVGARLSHVLENLSDFTSSPSIFENLKNVFNIGSGGLTYYGGFILAFPTLVIYARVKKIPLRLGMDIVAPCLMVGLAFGRIGCFLNGCCYGAECNLPWAVEFPHKSYAYEDQVISGQISDAAPHSLPVHPAQLYSSATAFLLAALLLAYFTLPHTPGMVFAVMMVLEGIARFVLETLRVEPPVMHVNGYGLSLSMVLGIVLAIAGGILALVFHKIGGSSAEPTAMLAPA